MPATRACLLSLITWMLCACITYPVVEPRQDLSCPLVTRELTLKTKDMMAYRKDCVINAFNCLAEAASQASA
jgi:hypothetical protein